MNNLILGAAYGYKTELLEPFVKSLRRNYQGDCCLIVSPLDQTELEFFDKYNIITFELEDDISDPKNIQVLRYEIYKQILEENFEDVNRIFISDVRDVIFQNDPFLETVDNKLEFFVEPCLFKNCNANWPWIGGIYGQEGMEIVKDQWIVCSGTTMGDRTSILNYLDTMILEMNRIKSTGRPLYHGEDQPIHNYLIYTEKFKNYLFRYNDDGPVTTIHHETKFTFDRKGQLLNKKGLPIPIVHQWDRTDACKKVLENTALNGPLK